MRNPKRRGGARRALRSRPLPQWLRQGTASHPIALARCLLILRVLSGAEPVSRAITTAQISRPTYYWLERKGLGGMLAALTPAAPHGRRPRISAATAERARLEEKVRTLEQATRRAERLLMVTRTVLPRLRRRRRSTSNGARPLRASVTGRSRRRAPLIPIAAPAPPEPIPASS